MKNLTTFKQNSTAFLNQIALGVLLCLFVNVKSQSNVCWTTQTGNIGNSAIFSCSSNTTVLNADTLLIRHSVTIGSSNNQTVDYSSADFSIISLENNATLSPHGSNNILRLPPFAEININTGSSIVNGVNNSQGIAIEIPNSNSFNFSNGTNVVCVWGTKCCVGNQSIIGPSLLIGVNPCNFFVMLPVTIVDFISNSKNNTIELKWSVIEESNFSHYDVYVSNNSGEFKYLGVVNSDNESNQLKQYSFSDLNPESGLNVYKLKLVDKFGEFQWSQSAFANKSSNPTTQNVTLYPNPSNSVINICFNDIILENYNITVQDLQGKVISSNDILDVNASQITFDINTLDKGIYVVKVTNEYGVITIKKFTKI